MIFATLAIGIGFLTEEAAITPKFSVPTADSPCSGKFTEKLPGNLELSATGFASMLGYLRTIWTIPPTITKTISNKTNIPLKFEDLKDLKDSDIMLSPIIYFDL